MTCSFFLFGNPNVRVSEPKIKPQLRIKNPNFEERLAGFLQRDARTGTQVLRGAEGHKRLQPDSDGFLKRGRAYLSHLRK